MLGRRWVELSSQPFEKISIFFQGGKVASISRDDCASLDFRFATEQRLYLRPNDYRQAWDANILAGLDFDSKDSIKYASEQLGISRVALQAWQKNFNISSEQRAAQKNLKKCIEIFELVSLPSTLYLPTYRRIELELKKLFDEIPERMSKQLKDRQTRIENTEFLVEVVRFGMDDVEDRLSNFERDTRDYARNQFNKMMTTYLKDMAAGKAMSVRELRDIPLDQNMIDRTLSRIEEGLLTQSEKRDIAQTVISLSQGNKKGNPTFQKSWLAHFFIKLFNVNADLESRESNVTSLITAINNYISPKKMIYDIESYHTAIVDNNGNELRLTDLSSGEKQIISMLAEVHFRNAKFNVLIDEPELSLSVPWQVAFLNDIKSAPLCNQVLAVTHSPFIYDNSLSSSVVEFGYA